MADEPKRRLALTKTVDLSDLAPGWDGAEAVVVGATGGQQRDLAVRKGDDSFTDADSYDLMISVCKDNFVSGKVPLIGSDGLVDMQPDDIELSVELATRLFSAIMGVDLDPKASEKAQQPSTTAATDGKLLEAPSSLTTAATSAQVTPSN